MRTKALPFLRAAGAAFVVLLLAFAGLTQVKAQTFTVGDLNYSINDDGSTVTLTGHVDGFSGQLVIPESVQLYGNDYPVTIIGDEAFENCGLTGSLVIPTFVTRIGSRTFAGNNITSLTLNNNLAELIYGAFEYCSNITEVTIPRSVRNLENHIFGGCTNLATLNYNAVWAEGCVGGGWNNWLEGTSLSTVNIGDGVQCIPCDFLNDVGNLPVNQIVLPESVTQISWAAFSNYHGSVNISSSVTTIGGYAFNACVGLTGDLVLPETLVSIGEYAFHDCTGLTGSLTIPNLVKNIDQYAFSGCSGLSGKLTLGASLESIRDWAFYGFMNNITEVDVLTVTPPSLGGNVFVGSAATLPVMVPCGAVENYQNTSGWNAFANIQESDPCFAFINVTVYSPAGGVVSGAGLYEQGQTCTLTATPNESFVFLNWSENGEVVSTDPEYSFVVESNRDLEAVFLLTTLIDDFNDGYVNSDIWVSGGGSATENNGIIKIEKTSSWEYAYLRTANAMPIPENGQLVIDRRSMLHFAHDSFSAQVLVRFDRKEDSWVRVCYVYDYNGKPGMRVDLNLDGYYTESYLCDYYFNVWMDEKIVVDFNHGKLMYYRDGEFIKSDDLSRLLSYPVGYYTVEFGIDDSWDTGECHYMDYVSINDSDVYYVSCEYNEVAGVVNGYGAFELGQTCTLTAIPNEEWAFVNWTEDGEEVSTDVEYAFTVTGNRNLVANFRNIRHEIYVSVRPENGGVVNAAKDGSTDQWYYYDNGNFWGNAGNDGGRFWWGVMFPAGSYDGNQVAKVAVYDCCYMTGTLTIYNDGTNAPANPVSNKDVTLTGSGEFVELGLDSPAWIDPSKNLWIVFGYLGGSYYPAAASEYTGDPNGSWMSLNGSSWFNTADYYGWYATFMVRVSMEKGQPIGSFLEGETCTLTATPNEGWTFYNWWENGEVVSTDPEYSFTIETDRNLLVRFKNPNTIDFVDPNVEAICVSLWDTDGDGFISYEEAAAVTDLGNVFQGKTEITSFDELQYFTGLISITDNAFNGCSSLVSVTFPEGLTAIGSGAFQDCVSLTGDLVIPNTVVTIGDYAYRECASLNSLTIGNSVTYIGHNAFYHCYGMSGELIIPNSVETIGIGVFIDCGFTGTLTLGSGLTSIGNAAFRRLNVNEVHWNAVNCSFAGDNWDAPIFAECHNLSTLIFADDVVTIPEYAFLNCSSLTVELTLPSSLTYIGGCAFYGCSSLTGSLVIPDAVEYIGWGSFSNTGFNGTLTIGQSVSQIDEGAFEYTGFIALDYWATNCNYVGVSYMNDSPSVFYGITTVNFGDNVESIPSRAFRGCDSFTGTLTLPNSLKSIGDQAFYNCYGFESIVMGNSLETIGNEAFRNCGGFRGELTLPESLQSVGTYAFAGCDEINTVNYNAINCNEMGNAQQPVFFDCASIEHINIGSAVESMPNYAFKRCSNVTDMHTAATVPPVIQASTFAAVPRSIPVLVPSGSGDAYRSAQYWEEFFNIMEDGEQYSFHWDVDAHQYAHNLSVIGLVQINGVEQNSPAIEIGAFCGDECRGRQMLTAYPDLSRSLVFLTVFGEEGDLITFRLYDHEAEEESTLACATVLTFEADAIVGSYNEPEVLNFVEMQNTAIEAGWTWFSTYIDADGTELLQMMEESLGENGVMIKSHTDGFVSYDENGWMGNLTSVNPESMYMVNTSAPAVVSLTGPFADASEHPVTLSPEWNWIGYPSNRAASLNNALSGFTAQDGDLIKMQESFSQYIEGIGWTGALKTLVPGEGLMYHSLNSGATTLTYVTGAKDDVPEKNITAKGNHWIANTKAYPYNMSVMAVVGLDGEEARDGRYELGAFYGDECRGSARLMYVESLDRYLAFVSVSGNGAADLTWLLFDDETKEVYRADEGLRFDPNAIVGAAKDPLRVSFSGLAGAEELMQLVSCYPNPVSRNEYVRLGLPAVRGGEARVEIMNAQGALVSSARVDALNPEVKAPAAAGVYVMRVTIDGKGVVYAKLIVE